MKQTRQYITISLGLLLVMLSPLSLQAAEPAGYVLMAAGEVEALQTNRQTRKLKRRSPIYPGESIRTGAGSKAQVRFRDGSLISLRAQTEIHIDEFRFDQPREGEDKNIFSLVSGGFRTITGKIGKQNPDNYRMKSSVASIGVRGTTYEVVMDQGLNVAAWQGSIVVENSGGRMTLGVEGRYNFAVVPSARVAPRGLMQPPRAITDEREIKPDEIEGEDGGDDGSADEAAGEDPADENEGTLAEEVNNETEGEFDDSLPLSMADNDPVPDTESETTDAVTSTPNPLEPAVDPWLPADVTLDRVGMAVVEGAGVSQMLAGGQAGQDGNGVYYIADNGLDPSEAGFESDPYVQVLTQGQAPMGTGMPLSFTIDANHSVTLGVWEAAVVTPAELRTDANDATVFTAVEQPLFWSVSDLTPDTAFSGLSGQAVFRNVVGFIGGGSAGAVNDVYMNLSVNFDTLAATGTVHIYTPGELWNLSLSGSLARPTLDFTSVSGDVNGSAVQGEFNSLFSGDGAQALVSSFDLEAVADPSTYLSGVTVVDDTAVGDLRLSSADLSSIDRVGLAMKVNAQAGPQWLVGPASDGAVGSGPLLVDNGLSPSDPAFASAPPLEVLRQDGATLSSSYTDPVYPVSWGVWSAGAQIQMSDYDPLDAVTLTEPLRWMTVTASDPADPGGLAGKSGSARFAPIYAEGVDETDTAFVKFFVGLEVDFDLAQFSGSGGFETAGGGGWEFFFDGGLNGAELIDTGLSASFYDTLGNESAANGELSMLFTGAIAGAYEFELSGDPSQYIMGNFLLGQDLRLSSADLSILGRYGVAMKTNSLTGMEWVAGLASDGSLGNPIIAENFGHSGDPLFYDLPLSDILRSDGSITQIAISDATYPVSWGIWNSGSELHTDPADPAAITAVTDPVVWMTVTPTPDSALAGLGGRGFYFKRQCCAGGYFGQTETGYGIQSLSFDLGLNFDSGRFSGRLSVSETDTDFWDVIFTGDMLASQLSVNAIDAGMSFYSNYSATLGTTGVDGDLTLVLTGNNAEALAVAYDFESTSDSAYFVQGAFVAEQDLRLSATEMGDMRRVGLLSGGRSGFGMATTAASTPTLVHSGYAPGNPWFDLASVQSVYRRGAAPEDMLGGHAVSGNSAYQVNWGRWNAAAGSEAIEQTDPADAAAQNLVAQPLYWLSMTPTPVDTLAGMTGQLNYTVPVGIAAGSIGGTGDGDVNPASFTFNANVDFDTGMLSGGTMYVEHMGGQSWNMNFSSGAGMMTSSGTFESLSASGLYNATDTAGGTMDLMLTGANAEGLAGRFDFSAFSGVAKDINGVFLVCQSGGC